MSAEKNKHEGEVSIKSLKYELPPFFLFSLLSSYPPRRRPPCQQTVEYAFHVLTVFIPRKFWMYCPVAGIDDRSAASRSKLVSTVMWLIPWPLTSMEFSWKKKKLNNYQPPKNFFFPPFLSSISDVFFFNSPLDTHSICLNFRFPVPLLLPFYIIINTYIIDLSNLLNQSFIYRILCTH